MKIKYTPEQIKAIGHRHGHLQILACAGSGKTEVISKRVAELVAKGVPKSAIVAFTFTDRAADELKARIRAHLEGILPDDPALGDMYVGTIHSFCLQILRELNPEFRRYEVMDEARQAALIMSNYSYSPVSDRGIGLSRLRDRTRTKGYWDTIRTFITTISVIHQKEIDISRIEDTPLRDCIERYHRIAYGYPNYFFDFDHIIGKLISELAMRPDELEGLRTRFQHLVIDEYQDIDDRQEELIALLSNHGSDVNLTVVGDDDQAIYGWRGARIKNILTFNQRYPNVTQIKLTYNFRSTHAITEVADAAVRKIAASERLPKDMEARHWDESKEQFVETMAHRGDLRVRSLETEEAEANWVADRIEKLRGALIDERGGHKRAIDYADMAILLRSVRGAGKVFSETLQKRGIPRVVKGVGGLFDHDEVLLVQATFCLLARSDMLVGIEGRTIRMEEVEIRDFIRSKIRELRDSANAMPRANETQFLEWIAAKREELDKRSLERERRGRLARRIYPQDIFQQMLHQLGSGLGPDPWPTHILYNLGRLSGLITDFEAVHQWITPSQLKALCVFLGGWAASQVDEGGVEEGVAPNAVQIMTVHAAKGLEWPVVFVPRVSSANFPSSLRKRGPSTFLDDELFDASEYAAGDDGERRLWYVALTRCRRFLNVSSPDRRNKRPTGYFKDIQHDIVGRDDEEIGLEKANPTPPADTELLPTTYTELNYYWRCPFEYQLRALMGFQPGVSESYGYGQQIHNVLAEVHQSARDGRAMSSSQISQLVESRFHLRYTRDGETHKPLTLLRDSARKSIRRYLDSYPDSTRFVLEAEKPFEFVDRETGALISGTVDLIQRIDSASPDGERRIPVAIVDFKTHHWGDVKDFLRRKEEVEAQLRLYSAAVGHSLGFESKEAYAHFLSPQAPPQGLVDQGVLERVDVDVSEESQQAVRGAVRRAVSGIQESVKQGSFRFEGVENGICNKCDFRLICPGFPRWQKFDRTTPRPGSREHEREIEIAMVAEDLNAG